MNNNDSRTGSPRWPGSWRVRIAASTTAVTSVVLLVAACGGSSSSQAAASAQQGSAKYQTALAYSRCMRAHGVPNFPDPNSQGHFPINQQSVTVGAKEASVAAQAACRSLLPNGGQPNAAARQQEANQMLQYSECMRAQGIPNFPDPVNGGFSSSALSGINTNSPQFNSANRTCRAKGQTVRSGSGS